jgi:hypothetical protein
MHQQNPPIETDPPQKTREFYLRALEILDHSGVPYVVCGGYAMAFYTGIVRHTKDLDVCIKRSDREKVLDDFATAGFRTELTWPHFLVKVLQDGDFIDLLYNSGNGLCPTDDEWFTNAERGPVLGRVAPICPVEEMIWPKAFVQDRNRFDGADIAHLILRRGKEINWNRLVRRFRGHEGVLLGHLMFFSYIYPGHADHVPQPVMDELFEAARSARGGIAPTRDDLCKGTYLSWDQYAHDVDKAGFADARVKPAGPLTKEEVVHFTVAR